MSLALDPDRITQSDVDYMKLALRQARLAELAGEVPIGAVVVMEASIIGTGYNRPIRQHDPTAHAEIVALRAAARRCRNYRLSGATLYVTAEPCVMCAGALVHARLARLVYGCADPKAGAIQSFFQIANNARLNHRIKVLSGVLENDCATLLREFFAAKRSKRSPKQD